jgi:hypothetical protein
VEFVVDKVALGQVSSEYFGLSCHGLLDTHHHPSSGDEIDQIATNVSSGLGLTPARETKEKIVFSLLGLVCLKTTTSISGNYLK